MHRRCSNPTKHASNGEKWKTQRFAATTYNIIFYNTNADYAKKKRKNQIKVRNNPDV